MAVRFFGVNNQCFERGTALGPGPSPSSFSVCMRGTLRGDRNAISSFFTYELAGAFTYFGLQFDASGTQLRINYNNAVANLANLAVGDDFFVAITCAGVGTGTFRGFFARPTDSALTTGAVDVTAIGTTFSYIRVGDNAYVEPTDLSLEYLTIYDSVLTPTEVARQWRSPSPIKPAWGFYPMTDTTVANSALDVSGNARHFSVIEGGQAVEASPLFGGPILTLPGVNDILPTSARPKATLTY